MNFKNTLNEEFCLHLVLALVQRSHGVHAHGLLDNQGKPSEDLTLQSSMARLPQAACNCATRPEVVCHVSVTRAEDAGSTRKRVKRFLLLVASTLLTTKGSAKVSEPSSIFFTLLLSIPCTTIIRFE